MNALPLLNNEAIGVQSEEDVLLLVVILAFAFVQGASFSPFERKTTLQI